MSFFCCCLTKKKNTFNNISSIFYKSESKKLPIFVFHANMNFTISPLFSLRGGFTVKFNMDEFSLPIWDKDRETLMKKCLFVM